MDYSVNKMYYHFDFDYNKESALLAGDMGGNIKLITFYSFITLTPFKQQVGSDYTHILYSALRKVNL
jgi:hypothetical protein